MRRLLIIGSPGSGKSKLAKELALMTGLPLIHLDQIYWRPKWIEPSKAEWRNQLHPLLATPAWIMDGNYGGSLPLRMQFADTVILLDLPASICLWRVTKRLIFSWRRNRPDMAKDCPERFDLTFLLYVASFRRKKLPGLRATLKEFSGQTIVLTSQRQMRELRGSLRPHGEDQLPSAS
ncbi:DNA topology modulation protein [soil metagenome]